MISEYQKSLCASLVLLTQVQTVVTEVSRCSEAPNPIANLNIYS